MSPARLQKRYMIAVAIVAGVKIAEVARQLNVSRSWASREAHTPGTRHLLAQLMARQAGRMMDMLHTSHNAVLDALTAEKVIRVKGRTIKWPDHRIRLDAVEVAIQFFEKLKPAHWAALSEHRKTHADSFGPAGRPDHRTRLAAARTALRFIEKWDPPLGAVGQAGMSHDASVRSRAAVVSGDGPRRCTNGSARRR
jgi:hypothetical protein